MKKVCIIEILLMIVMTMSILTIPGVADTNTSNTTSVTYNSDVDQDYGFYRVIDYTTHKPAQYVNNTLTINVGDTVVWINDANPDWPLTIISKEGLWGNRSAYLRWNYQRFSYTFNQSGTYQVYIKEFPREQHQIIVVNPIEPIVTIVSTPIIVVTNIEIPPTEIIPTETVPTKKTQYLPVMWLLIIAGLIMCAIWYAHEIKRKKE
jgi:plastocyanin